VGHDLYARHTTEPLSENVAVGTAQWDEAALYSNLPLAQLILGRLVRSCDLPGKQGSSRQTDLQPGFVKGAGNGDPRVKDLETGQKQPTAVLSNVT
jgi:hypothetical protein